jgi:hypothetical protein
VLDLERVCEQCKNPQQRVIGRIEVGQKFHMQSSVPAGSRNDKRAAKTGKKCATDAGAARWILEQIHGRYPRSRFVVETKFDGWRTCLHVPDISNMATARCAQPSLSPSSKVYLLSMASYDCMSNIEGRIWFGCVGQKGFPLMDFEYVRAGFCTRRASDL